MTKTFILILFSTFYLFAQDKYESIPFDVKICAEKIKIDGILDEPVWQLKPNVSDFWQYFPNDSAKAKSQTEIWFTYDDKNLYLASKCYSKSNKFIVPSLRRDFRAGGNDNISFVFDTFNDKTNAFLFGINPLGVMREALISNGGSDNANFNTFWDNKWQGESKIYDGYWISEIAIPLSTLRYKDGSTRWNFMCYRFDTGSNETSSLVRIPQNQLIFNLAFTAPMNFEKPLKKPKMNISVIPYATAGTSKDFVDLKNPNVGPKYGVGGDVKVAITSGLNLDLTYNPDFSTVEADRQVTNLTRFDITYPEQRQFFLENSDLFSGFGTLNINPYFLNIGGQASQSITPFFSRRIGIAIDSTTGLQTSNKILYGARISGKIGNNWRVGVMNTQTQENEFKGIPATNYTVSALQRKVFSRSNISAIFINKENFNNEIGRNLNKFNRVAGLEYNLASTDNKWSGKVFYHHEFTPNNTKGQFAHGTNLFYSVRKFTVNWLHEIIGSNYNAEVGFVPRNNYIRIAPTFGRAFFPKSKIINRYIIGVGMEQYNRINFGTTDRTFGPFASVVFQNTARILVNFNQNYTYLFNDFDALRSSGKLPVLRKNTDYNYFNITMNMSNDQRKKLTFFAQPIVGQYFNGNYASLNGTATYRIQPYGFVSMNFSYNNINLKEGKKELLLVGPKFDVTFRKDLFWTTFLQYNSQFDNFNVNSRLQWRFAPVSDFFLVYTDNYNSTIWMPKNRAILAKFTYWLNL